MEDLHRKKSARKRHFPVKFIQLAIYPSAPPPGMTISPRHYNLIPGVPNGVEPFAIKSNQIKNRFI